MDSDPVAGSVEARWRLESKCEICVYETEALRSLEQPLLEPVIQAVQELRAKVEVALKAICEPPLGTSRAGSGLPPGKSERPAWVWRAVWERQLSPGDSRRRKPWRNC